MFTSRLKTIFIFIILFNSTLSFASSLLVDIDWLEKNLNSDSIRLIDMSDNTQFQRFHIPGATHLPYAAINVQTKQGVSLSAGPERIIKVLGLLGIEAQQHVVIYDDMGGLHASRLFWELERIGHKKISILNGGLVKWILAGKKVTAEISPVKKTTYKAATKLAMNNVISAKEILNSQFDDNNILLDVRSKDEYIGNPRYIRSGHIPNAKWWEWQQAVNFDNAFQIQKDDELIKQFNALGLKNKNTPVTLYCQSAHRASHSYFTLRKLGFNQVKIYDGSMAEYSRIKTAPLIKGFTP